MVRWLYGAVAVLFVLLLALGGYYFFYVRKLTPTKTPSQKSSTYLSTVVISHKGQVFAEFKLPQGWSVVADCAGTWFLDKGGKISCETARVQRTPIEVHVIDNADIYKKLQERISDHPELIKTIQNKQGLSYKVGSQLASDFPLAENLILYIKTKDESVAGTYNNIINSLNFQIKNE